MSYQLLPGFVVRVAEQSTYDHWQGGPATHNGAFCDRCQRPFLLIWDINCADPRFVVDDKPVFKNLKRLPLYYCWRCCAELAYRVSGNERLQLFHNSGSEQEKDFPYPNYPLQFDRRPIELSRPDEMPKRVRDFLLAPPDARVPKETKAALSEWLGRPIRKAEFDIWWQQFGGEPWLIQGEEQMNCPNPKCSAVRRGAHMKILAAVCNDPLSGLPMIETMDDEQRVSGIFNRWVQIVYHICEDCDSPPLSDSGGDRIMVLEGGPKDERVTAGSATSLAAF